MLSESVRFGPFELNTRTGDLRKHGRRVPLSPQPARLLALLTTHAGDLLTRDAIRRQLWGDEVYADFERGLNSCLVHLRSILGDQVRAPRYIETLPRRGYRFIAPIERLPAPAPPTIAVLPFANLGGDPALECFADGMTDAGCEGRRGERQRGAHLLGAGPAVAPGKISSAQR